MPNVIPTPTLVELGWDDGWAQAFAESSGPSLTPGRVSRIDRGAFTALTADGSKRVGADRDQVVAVGDWVTLADETAATGLCRLAGVLPRRCTFRRAKEASSVEQVVAANIDTVLVTDAVDGFLTTRHLERYLALAWQSGVTPVVVITKADLKSPEACASTSPRSGAVALDVAVHVVSAATGTGSTSWRPIWSPAGRSRCSASPGREARPWSTSWPARSCLTPDCQRGPDNERHTTTHRQLVVLPGGGVLIDTPGMRALSVRAAGEGVARAFDDIENLSGLCEFPDCSHRSEPGCAILAAVESGRRLDRRAVGELAPAPERNRFGPPAGPPPGRGSKAAEGGRQGGAGRIPPPRQVARPPPPAAPG